MACQSHQLKIKITNDRRTKKPPTDPGKITPSYLESHGKKKKSSKPENSSEGSNSMDNRSHSAKPKINRSFRPQNWRFSQKCPSHKKDPREGVTKSTTKVRMKK